MTRKDYELIAQAIRDAQRLNPWTNEAEREAASLMQRTIAANLAGVLSRTNPRFDRERFLRAAEA